MVDELLDDGEFLVVGAVGFELWSGKSFWEVGEVGGERLFFLGGDFADFEGGEEGVVEAVVVFGEEEVARDFTSQLGPGFFHFGLDKAVAGLAHDGVEAEGFHFVDDDLGKFDVEDYFWVSGSGVAAGHQVAGEQEGDVVGAVEVAGFVDDSHAVTVAVKADTEVGVQFPYFVDEVVHVF